MPGQDDRAADDSMAAAINRTFDVEFPPAHDADTVPDALPILSEQRRQESMNDEAFEIANFAEKVEQQPETVQRSETVLYLAYGSNLCAETFKGRRGIKPVSEINVVVPEVVLTFDLPGLPYLEPCFANVRYRDTAALPAAHTHEKVEETPLLEQGQRSTDYHKDRWKKGLVGVVYEVSRKDYATIIRTEGGGASYQDIVVNCYPLLESSTVPEHPDTAVFRAHTLYAPSNVPSQDPTRPKPTDRFHRPDPSYAQSSPRYMKLLTDGADQHHLPLEYKTYLHNIRPFRITTRKQKTGRQIFGGIWMPLVFGVFRAERKLSDKNGRAPKWLRKINSAVFATMWASYDWVFKPLFGEGERTIGQEEEGIEPA